MDLIGVVFDTVHKGHWFLNVDKTYNRFILFIHFLFKNVKSGLNVNTVWQTLKNNISQNKQLICV